MRRFCPSITDLQAFEVTARQGSFTRAAHEMCITQGAVSKQIKHLETFLGVDLFLRTRGGLVLTHAGHSYLHDVRASLNRIEAASLALIAHQGLGGTLNLTCMPSFAAKWLIPRLPKLRRRYPDLHIGFLPHRMGYDFSSPDVDAAVRFGNGVWPGSRADYIVGKEVVPVCRPNLFKTPPESPEDLLSRPLLHHTTAQQSWPDWFRDAGHDTPHSREGARFDQFTLLTQAAIAGFGTALIPRCLVEEELQDGKLIVPLDVPITAHNGYYLCYPEHKSRLPTLQAFRTWMLDAMEAAPTRVNDEDVPAGEAALSA
ncbi:LysR family transcriptional regulator [Allopusillimonas soli]|uniref:LysR family transcriptional regulator n=1 Tax=Allopusillimonas soli TaxID=659016 RepID=A0A853FCC0_9BURK|nr:LysR substrate-binding domain-containing protein [Allopusillimonas soli]NYT36191.1 LysR family transcriptional regulator [Allopusillimonas soli]TEA76522.1 LysR family transcriptional regulator [Allopusillimonas soli]